MNNKQSLIALFSSVALLSACGGGGDAPPPAPPPATDAVPPSASASTLGLKDYLVDLGTMLVENKEPVDLSSFAPKTNEDSEPEPVS
jgi:hypothetical protein